MARLPGKLMVESIQLSRPLVQLPRILRDVPRVVAEMQARLHELDPEPLRRALEVAGLPQEDVGPAGISRLITVDGQLDQLRERIERNSLDGLEGGLRWLIDHRPPEPDQPVICHGDLHPLNMLMVGDDVSGVIDWPMTVVADPAFDMGNTMVLLGLAPMEFPAVLDWVAGALRSIVVRRYYEAYRRRRSVNSEAVPYYEALRCLRELAWVGELRLPARGAIGGGNARTPWAAPRPTRRLISRFRKVTGIAPALPSVLRAAILAL